MGDDLKRRDQIRETKKSAVRVKFRQMGQKWEENEKLVRSCALTFGNLADRLVAGRGGGEGQESA